MKDKSLLFGQRVDSGATSCGDNLSMGSPLGVHGLKPKLDGFKILYIEMQGLYSFAMVFGRQCKSSCIVT